MLWNALWCYGMHSSPIRGRPDQAHHACNSCDTDQGMHSSAMECTLVLSVGGPTKHFTRAIRVRPIKECTLVRSVCAIRVSPDQGMHSCAVCGRPDQAFHACSSCTDQRIAMRWVFFGFWPILWMGNKRFLYFMRTSKKSCAEY